MNSQQFSRRVVQIPSTEGCVSVANLIKFHLYDTQYDSRDEKANESNVNSRRDVNRNNRRENWEKNQVIFGA
jgi:hypothetical protein